MQLANEDALAKNDRLVGAMIDSLETEGHAAVSARSLALTAGTPVSSIYYHFGNLEQLSHATFREILARTARWMQDQLTQLPIKNADPRALAPVMAAVIDDWCTDQRALAFGWRECQLLAGRNPAYLIYCREWTELWSHFWRDICARCGMADAGTLTAQYCEGESLLHLIRWRRAIDRACLTESCEGWVRWMHGSLAAEGPWRRFAREEAERTRPQTQPLDAAGEAIAYAAADLVAEGGLGNLTHRAVAARADVTLGFVSYKFRTRDALLRAAFDAIYRRVVPPESSTAWQPHQAGLWSDQPHDGEAPEPMLRAIDDMIVAAARDSNLAIFASQLRYLRGQTSGRVLAAKLERPVSPLDAALFSSLGMGQARALIGTSAAEQYRTREENLDIILERIGG
ncbi:TetR/AcrR family transcriptional regulator [Stakelama tenebrarum]|uniref:TetR family transcriptional regulator n=1 Tax=Stakelama tenebrarum TaxID=2711215 RepID=A0A6G6Y6N3_9SPHN|nr:TetR/AcrR family transcriptional regulator [Sphingosinithalassobacter tenebrarum]QIG80457.1 TetR family transcriptional regulator [Sphingosinithalassobacter tenebrarum]